MVSMSEFHTSKLYEAVSVCMHVHVRGVFRGRGETCVIRPPLCKISAYIPVCVIYMFCTYSFNSRLNIKKKIDIASAYWDIHTTSK